MTAHVYLTEDQLTALEQAARMLGTEGWLAVIADGRALREELTTARELLRVAWGYVDSWGQVGGREDLRDRIQAFLDGAKP